MTQRADPRVVGGHYHNGYWNQDYEVEAIMERDGTRWFLVGWADGHATFHCTAWDWKRDRILTPAVS